MESAKPGDRGGKDVLFNVLKNPKRRIVLRRLRDEGQLEFGELAKYVAAEVNEKDESEVSERERKRAYVSLYQAHLKKLEGLGFIEWDRDSSTVSPLDNDVMQTALQSIDLVEGFTAKDEGRTVKDIFHALQTSRRRLAINYLWENNQSAEFGDLANFVAKKESDEDEVTESLRKRVYIALYQTHLPILEEVGLIEYDEDSGRVELVEMDERIPILLDETSGISD